jgi:K+-sensing histidine kinase KdpD
MREADLHLQARQQVCAALDTTIGFLLCTSLAMLVCFLFIGTVHSSWIPLFFVSVVSGVGVVYGALGALTGLFSSAYVFACFLFYPIGEPFIRRAGARMSLEWMLGLGLFMVYVFGKRTHQRRKDPCRSVSVNSEDK